MTFTPYRICPLLAHSYHQLGNITGLGIAVVTQLFDKQLITDVSDLYKLSVADLLKLDKVKEKSAEKLYQSILASKTNSVEKLILLSLVTPCTNLVIFFPNSFSISSGVQSQSSKTSCKRPALIVS